MVLCNLIIATLNMHYFYGANPECAAYVDDDTMTTPSPSEPSNVPSEDAKLDALLSLLLLTERLPSLPLFNHLWPYFIEILSDSLFYSSEVRCLALEGLVQSLERATVMAACVRQRRKVDIEDVGEGGGRDEVDPIAVLSDSRFVNDFLLPSLAPLAQDPSVDVRMAMAQSLPRLTNVCSK